MSIQATLHATPTTYDGLAPALIRFEGNIEVSGLTSDCTLQYHFVRSDGGYDRNIRHVHVKKPGGSFPVSTQWKLSPPEYSGWEAVEVLAPERVQSNRAPFTVTTHRLDLAVRTFKVLVNTHESTVKFGAVIANVGDVDVQGPVKIIIGAGIDHWVTVQSNLVIPSLVVIPANSTYDTEYAAEQELWPNREYWVDIILDPDRELQDFKRTNDRLRTKWISPAT